ncbi:MAG: hypothetical protein PHZ19_09405 [Candidatus Thermoplasmatota archaeon]|nr:hypothetical protein [Candidatus Thermoplasmatota archaeon]
MPFYLVPPGDATPGLSWAVELTPEGLGTYVVEIGCNANVVTVTVQVIEVPEADIPFGFWTDHHRCGDGTQHRAHFEDMRAHGFNTFTPYARGVGPYPCGPQALAWYIDTAIEVGLVDLRFPLFCLSITPEDIGVAAGYAKHEWPELISYNRDEPPVRHKRQVAEHAARAHAVGRRTGTAIAGHHALVIGQPLDIWIVHMDTMFPEVAESARAQGKELWVYTCALRGTNAPLHRYWTGVYTWAVGAAGNLTWAYMHDRNSRIHPDGTWALTYLHCRSYTGRDGKPQPTVSIKGMQEGIIDYRLLRALEATDTPEGNAYLTDLRGRVDPLFWPDGKDRTYTKYPWDVPDVAIPPVCGAEMRQEVLRLLGVQ